MQEYSQAQQFLARFPPAANDESRNSREAKDKGVFSNTQFNRVNMRGLTIAGKFQAAEFNNCNLVDSTLMGGLSAFQSSSFVNTDLSGAVLTGGGGAFQLSSFVRSNLSGAVLTGAGNAFQASSFADADLSGAVLTGGSGSFQGANFQRAKLVDARIVCPTRAAFLAVIVDSAQFQGADLSAITVQALESCNFETPPSYDGNTKFPSGFDPSEQLWERVP